MRPGTALAAVAVRGVRGALPAHALREHFPLLRHDLFPLQADHRGGGEGRQRLHRSGIGRRINTEEKVKVVADVYSVPCRASYIAQGQF